MGMPGGDVARRGLAVARLQALAQFAGEEIRRGVAVADLQDDQAALARSALHASFERRRHLAIVLGLGWLRALGRRRWFGGAGLRHIRHGFGWHGRHLRPRASLAVLLS